MNCGDTIVGPFGNISSPNYPENYPANSHCIYRIIVNSNKIIHLKFEDFNVEYSKDCVNDYVQVRSVERMVFC